MSNNTLLEIDDSILNKNLLLPENQQDEDLEKMMKYLESPSPKFVIIRPIPGICVKTKTNSGEKVFINICHTPEIPAPDDITDAELIDIIMEENPSYCVPMSIANERFENDKLNQPCLTYDVAINSKYFEKCQEKKTFLTFTITVTIDGISNKFEKDLNSRDFVVLKNRKVMGKILEQRIEKRAARKSKPPKKLIEELPGSSSSVPVRSKMEVLEDSKGAIENENVAKDYVIFKQSREGKVVALLGIFKLPEAISLQDVIVDVNEDRLIVECRKTGKVFDLWLPYKIITDQVTAFLDKNIGVVKVDMPIFFEDKGKYKKNK